LEIKDAGNQGKRGKCNNFPLSLFVCAGKNAAAAALRNNLAGEYKKAQVF
jgi:hypothetical protein